MNAGRMGRLLRAVEREDGTIVVYVRPWRPGDGDVPDVALSVVGGDRPAPQPSDRPRRYDQCDETCTVDCGHCKGNGPPDRERIVRAIAEALNDSVNQRLAGPDMLESLPDEWSVEAQEIAAALMDGPNPLVVPTSPGMAITLRGLAEINQDIGRDNADARWRADLAPLFALHAPHQLATSVSSIHTALGEHLPIRTTYRTVCRYCSPNDSMAAWPCPTIAALPERMRE